MISHVSGCPTTIVEAEKGGDSRDYLPSPEVFNSEFAPEKLPKANRKVVFQAPFFRGKLAVKLRGGIGFW